MAPPVKVQLSYSERRALEELAEQNMRRPSDMLRWLIQQEAQRRGLVKNEGNGARLDNEPVTLALNA
jgi:hypothetical protein